MKKIILFLMIISCITLTSCTVSTFAATSADIEYSDYSYTSEYQYLGVWYPVVYFNSIPYYYYNNTWVVIHSNYYPHIRHFSSPRMIRGRHFYHSSYHRPAHHKQHIYHHNRPNIHSNSSRHHFDQRPGVRPSSTRTTVNQHHGKSHFNRGHSGGGQHHGGRR